MMASLYHSPSPSPSASVTRLVASMEDSKFMTPSHFPARDEWTVREEGGSAIRAAVVLESGQNRSKSAGGEGAPKSLSDFVHGDATDKELKFGRASNPVLTLVSCCRGLVCECQKSNHDPGVALCLTFAPVSPTFCSECQTRRTGAYDVPTLYKAVPPALVPTGTMCLDGAFRQAYLVANF